jgi:hypothetical protein
VKEKDLEDLNRAVSRLLEKKRKVATVRTRPSISQVKGAYEQLLRLLELEEQKEEDEVRLIMERLLQRR